MALNEPLPWESVSEGAELWSEEDEAESWANAAAALGG